MNFFTKTGIWFIGILFVAAGIAEAQSKQLSEAEQINAAVSAAPENMQSDATVMGYNENKDLETFQEGENQLICIADDPAQDNFHVACYHKDLDPFMNRGRELKAEGLSRKKIDSLRQREIEEGEIELPQKPMALYSLTGSADSYDYTTGQIIDATPLYVVYIPYATEESTGLSKKPASKGAPWIMEPGTPWAHIMVITGRGLGIQR